MKRFEALDAWRGIAALMVALYHFGMNTHAFDLAIVKNSSLFVDFFFVLSGFVISHAYADALRQGMSFTSYAIKRIGRLWPLHMAVIVVLLAFELHDAWLMHVGRLSPHPLFVDSRSLSLLVQNIFLVQALGFERHIGWNGPSWSISTELWVCFAFAGLCLMLSKRSLLVAAVAIVAASATILAVFSPTYMSTYVPLAMFKCATGFFAGHIVYRLHDTFRGQGSTFAEIAVVTVMVVYLSVVDAERKYPADPLTMLAPVVFSIAVFVFSSEGGAISSILKRRYFLTLGAISYSIYMVHDTIAWKFGARVRACIVDKSIDLCSPFRLIPQTFQEGRFFADIMAITYLMIVIVISLATYRFIEEPGRRFFNKIANRYAATTVMPVAPTTAPPADASSEARR